jgi:hypothetical protein
MERKSKKLIKNFKNNILGGNQSGAMYNKAKSL